jgi:hypothetical protein
MDREEEARRWREALADEPAHVARVAFARAGTRAFEAVGRHLYLSGDVLRDDSAKGVSLATRIGSALARGTCDLLDAANAYGASALLRQFVEVEYLLWTFADDPQDATRWLHASRSQLEGRFRPAAMRKRSGGRFRSAEYRAHCDTGGHPSPRGWFLVAHRPPVDPVRSNWVDLGQHLSRGWDLLVNASQVIGSPEATAPHVQAFDRDRDLWRERDALACRMAITDG